MAPYAFGRNNFDYNQGYEDGFKWSHYDYSRKPGPEYDAGFMAGYFEKNGRPYDGETYTQQQNAYKAEQYEANSHYAKTLFGDANPFTIQATAILKAFLALIAIAIISSVSGGVDHIKNQNKVNIQNSNTPQQEELNYAPTAQKPNVTLEEQEKTSKDTLTQADWEPYMRELQRRIKMNWSPVAGSEEHTVDVMFKVAKDGRLLSYEIQKSSGISEVDRAAVQAIEFTAPFRPLPDGFKEDSVDIQFTFDYHKIR